MTSTQREADLLGALRDLVAKIDAIEPHINGIISFAFTHSVKYRGPVLDPELSHAKRLIEEFTATATPTPTPTLPST